MEKERILNRFKDTQVTRLIENIVAIKAASKRLGQASIETTYNIYVKVTTKMENETVNPFEELSECLNIPEKNNLPYFE